MLVTLTRIWLTSLVSCPAPLGPQWVMVLPMCRSSGSTLSNAFLSPPTMIDERRVARADVAAADRGVEQLDAFRRAAASAQSARGGGGDRRVIDDDRAACDAWMMPSSPRTTASTSGVSVTQMKTTSALRAASAGVVAHFAPRAISALGLRLRAREDRQRMPGGQQMPGHRQAHDAQADEGEFAVMMACASECASSEEIQLARVSSNDAAGSDVDQHRDAHGRQQADHDRVVPQLAAAGPAAGRYRPSCPCSPGPPSLSRSTF